MIVRMTSGETRKVSPEQAKKLIAEGRAKPVQQHEQLEKRNHIRG